MERGDCDRELCNIIFRQEKDERKVKHLQHMATLKNKGDQDKELKRYLEREVTIEKNIRQARVRGAFRKLCSEREAIEKEKAQKEALKKLHPAWCQDHDRHDKVAQEKFPREAFPELDLS